ncbi:MAG: Multidrug resistance protein MdtB [Lentisphaerae bacterium ADurb.BinA184]|nr:MAG: Multidrug resistance protein MdtB [Lentisphaerae bacterium ADurb.BinA184]
MKLSQASINRPVFTMMVVLIVLILGGVSLVRLPVDLMPDITYPALSVSTSYENAGPEEVEELVTRPIEEAMSAVPGVEEVASTSSEGSSNVRVTFTWGTDLDAAAGDVRDRLDRVVPRLPDDVDRPVLRKFDLASFPVLILGAHSRLDPVQFRRLLDDQVKYRIERVPGVAAVDVFGGQEREIRVHLNADKIKALNLSLDTILARIEAGNVNVPAGTIDRGNFEVLVRTPGEFSNLDELRETVVAVRDGAPVPLREIAEVEDAWERIRRVVRVNGQPGLRIAVNKQSGTNTVEVSQAVLREVELVNEELPQISILPIIDSSKFIRRSISNVGQSALLGGGLAILVLLFFLRNVRSTVIIGAAIPISIIATFGLMYFYDYTLNLMTLGGLALGVGMLVDNAIVVLENIYRLRESGQEAVPAAVQGTEEVGGAIMASTLTTVVVFLPLVFMRGMAGVMFKQLSVVIAFALLCSMAVALTLVPMLAARILHPRSLVVGVNDTLLDRLFRLTGGFFDAMENAYRGILGQALRNRGAVLILTFILVAGSAGLARFLGTELMPASDEGEVRVDTEAEIGTRLAVADRTMRQVEAIVAASVPERESMVSNVGGSGWRSQGSHRSEIRLALVPQAQRTRSSEDVAADLRARLSGIPGLTVRVRAGQGMFIPGMGAGAERIQIEVRGHDLEVADVLAKRIQKAVEPIAGITDVQLSRESGSPEELILVDRRKAADMKLTVSEVASALETALSGSPASYYREGGDEYPIRVQMKDSERMTMNEVLDLTVANADGLPVVLRNVVNVQPRRGPVIVERKDQERLITVSANMHDRDMGSLISEIREHLREIPVPRSFSLAFGGDYEEQQKAFRELGMSLVLALVLVYMVMACQFESLRDPFVVMFSVPLAVIGVVLTLLLTDTTFNMQSFIGCIMLGGIVVNNAILLVDHTNLLRRRDGMPLHDAIEEAGRRRLRPILMTALTTILGLLPLALGLGEGGEAQAPLARTVIGGLVSSTFITLLVIPVVYSVFERREASPQPPVAAAVEPPARG